MPPIIPTKRLVYNFDDAFDDRGDEDYEVQQVDDYDDFDDRGDEDYEVQQVDDYDDFDDRGDEDYEVQQVDDYDDFDDRGDEDYEVQQVDDYDDFDDRGDEDYEAQQVDDYDDFDDRGDEDYEVNQVDDFDDRYDDYYDQQYDDYQYQLDELNDQELAYQTSNNTVPATFSTAQAITYQTIAKTTPKGTEPIVQLENSGIHYYANKTIDIRNAAALFEGYFRWSHQKCAVKQIKCEGFNVLSNEIEVWKEIVKSKQDSSINIVRLYDCVKESSWYYFAMERADCDLSQRIAILSKDTGHSHRKLLVSLIENISDGLQWLHHLERPIVHRDIKPDNVLVFYCETENEIAKLGDFGVSRIVSNQSWTSTMACGTEFWMPPEAIDALRQNKEMKCKKSLDIFALGMTAYFTICLGSHPFQESIEYGKDIEANIRAQTVSAISVGENEFTANSLLQWMMQKEPDLRPNIDEVLAHPFFWDCGKSLKFVVDAVNSSCKKNEFWNRLDEAYRKYKLKHYNIIFNWQEKVNVELLNYKRKSYNGSSLRSLLELIRDKYQHHRELPSSLLDSGMFGDEEGKFNDQKYISYFLNHFPDILISIFCLSVNNQKYEFLKELDQPYFLMFRENCQWNDQPMKLLSDIFSAESRH